MDANVMPGSSSPSASAERFSRGEALALKVALGACLALLAVTALAGALAPGTTKALITDPSEVDAENYPAYYGLLSYLGFTAWTVGAALSLLAASIAGVRTPAGRFLLSAGALSGLLALDDLFLLHEHVGYLVPLGEHLTIAAYGALAAGVMWHGRDFVREQTPVRLLLLAGALLGGSAAIDLAPVHPPFAWVVEDALKFVGIVVWAAYLGIVARRVCVGALGSRRGQERPAARNGLPDGLSRADEWRTRPARTAAL